MQFHEKLDVYNQDVYRINPVVLAVLHDMCFEVGTEQSKLELVDAKS
jgi:hypothetical protein